MEKLVKAALRIITVLILLATVVSFSESYHGLFEWAISHSVPWFWALIWPLMLDTVILVGECSVFVAIHKHWKLRHRIWAWSVTFSGLAVSTLANGGHVASRDWLTHLTNALPPIALMFALTVGLGVLKRVRMMPAETSQSESEKPLTPRTERPAKTPAERSHLGTKTWIESPAIAETFEAAPKVFHHTEGGVWAPPLSGTGVLSADVDHKPAETAEPVLTETMQSLGFKAIPGKSFSMPRDPRPELSLAARRVRDMFDVDPDISVNSIAEKLGIAWATAKKHLDATKEARGVA